MLKAIDRVLSLVLKPPFIEKPIFIWGAPRSGTTLLYEQLLKHDDVGYLGLDKGTLSEGTGFWWETFKMCRGTMDASMANTYRIWKIRKKYKEMLDRQGKTRLLDKIPFMILWIPLVNEVFPDARHIHIIRDGRAVVNSVLYKVRSVLSGKPC